MAQWSLYDNFDRVGDLHRSEPTSYHIPYDPTIVMNKLSALAIKVGEPDLFTDLQNQTTSMSGWQVSTSTDSQQSGVLEADGAVRETLPLGSLDLTFALLLPVWLSQLSWYTSYNQTLFSGITWGDTLTQEQIEALFRTRLRPGLDIIDGVNVGISYDCNLRSLPVESLSPVIAPFPCVYVDGDFCITDSWDSFSFGGNQTASLGETNGFTVIVVQPLMQWRHTVDMGVHVRQGIHVQVVYTHNTLLPVPSWVSSQMVEVETKPSIISGTLEGDYAFYVAETYIEGLYNNYIGTKNTFLYNANDRAFYCAMPGVGAMPDTPIHNEVVGSLITPKVNGVIEFPQQRTSTPGFTLRLNGYMTQPRPGVMVKDHAVYGVVGDGYSIDNVNISSDTQYVSLGTTGWNVGFVGGGRGTNVISSVHWVTMMTLGLHAMIGV